MYHKRNIILIAYLGFSLSCGIATAHDGDDARAAWFRALKSPDGRSCCDNMNCEEIDGDDYRPSTTTSGFEVRFRGHWLLVPSTAVLERTQNPTGHAVLCAVQYTQPPDPPTPICFVRQAEG